MKTHIYNLFLVPVLTASLALALPGRLAAQTFTNLYSFTAASSYPYTNTDGVGPTAGLVLSGNILYGTAEYGGNSAQGTVFAVHADGTGIFTNLHAFTALSGSHFTNSDGGAPAAGLISSGNFLYGTAQQGGDSGYGTLFRINTDGTGFTNLYSFSLSGYSSLANGFTNSDGASPVAGLMLSGGTLYGTAEAGGNSGKGTVFRINTDGTGFTNLYSFTSDALSPYTNSDGASPVAGLVLSDNILYGTAKYGGTSANGTVFRVNADGSGGFANLHNFPATASSFPQSNSDGANPVAGLVLAGNILYGTARNGGAWGDGTVFAIHTDGMSFTNLHDFSGSPGDGAIPGTGLLLSGDTMYGTTLGGGTSGAGTVFAIKTNGMDFTILYSFSAEGGSLHTNSDGANPVGLILSGNAFYGTAGEGGTFGGGTVFSLTQPQPPQLTITRSGTDVIVMWPADATGFTLEFATNLSPAVWSTNLPVPLVVNGHSTVTNPISGNEEFYRLSQ